MSGIEGIYLNMIKIFMLLYADDIVVLLIVLKTCNMV